MAANSRIEWTQTTWNPLVGCRKVSAGCANCYAERMAKRLAAMSRAARERGDRAGRLANYESVIDERGHWNGRVLLDRSALADPLTWKLPRVVFVNSMSDLFHESVPLETVRSVFEVMNRCVQHTFQVLTKRPQRAAEFSGKLHWSTNIWMGTSVENSSVLHRVRDLVRTGAAVRFLSIEPLLSRIARLPLRGIDWVIVGGESGPGARAMESDWVCEIRDQCVARNVAFFFKQWGGVNKKATGRILDSRTWDEMPTAHDVGRILSGAQG